MKKKMMFFMVLTLLVILPLSLVHALEVFRSPTEVLHWDKAKAYNGYTLIYPQRSPSAVNFTFLIDMEGNVVHSWPGGSNPKLMEDGHILSGFNEMDWDGNRVFSARGAHHDTWKIYNKKLKEYTYIGCTREQAHTEANAVAAGADPDRDYTGAYGDGIIEVDKNGKEIWRWRFLDHVVQDKNPAWPNYVGRGKTIADYPGKSDLNFITDRHRDFNEVPGVTGDWQHTNALDYNEKLDHIAINSKHWSEFYVVDHGATFIPGDLEGSIALAASDKGDFIYRFGNPSAYQQGKPPEYLNEGDQQMYGAHNIEWIDDGLPGAGNFLIFSNGCYNPKGFHSEVLEINPFLDASGKNTGSYVNPPDAGYGNRNNSNQIVWSYSSNMQTSFYSVGGAGAQRQANGNTLICSARQGHIFEVTSDKEVVWEYIVPVGTRGVVKERYDSDGQNFRAFRAYRFSPDFPAFKGKDLTPKGKITELFAGVGPDPAGASKRGGKKRGRNKGGGGKAKGAAKGKAPAQDPDQPNPDAFYPY